MQKTRKFLAGFAAAQSVVEEVLGLLNGWVLIIALALVMVALYLAQILAGWQDAVAVGWTLAMIVGADLYWLVTITRAHGHWLNWRTHWLPAVLWSLLGVYLGFVNYQSVVAYQFQWLEHMTWQQAFQHMGITLDQFIQERAIVLVLLIVINGIARHARVTALDPGLAPAPAPDPDPDPEPAPIEASKFRNAHVRSPANTHERRAPSSATEIALASLPPVTLANPDEPQTLRRTHAEEVSLSERWEHAAQEYYRTGHDGKATALMSFLRRTLGDDAPRSMSTVHGLVMRYRPARLELVSDARLPRGQTSEPHQTAV